MTAARRSARTGHLSGSFSQSAATGSAPRSRDASRTSSLGSSALNLHRLPSEVRPKINQGAAWGVMPFQPESRPLSSSTAKLRMWSAIQSRSVRVVTRRFGRGAVRAPSNWRWRRWHRWW